MKATICFDVDGVLADFTGAMLEVVNRVCGASYTHEDVMQFEFTEALKLTREQTHAVHVEISAPGFAAGLCELPAGIDAVRKLRATGHTIRFVTSPWDSSPTWKVERESWLIACFPWARDVVFAHDKSGVGGHLLIDDKPESCFGWWQKGRNALLVDQPWNRSVIVPHRVQLDHLVSAASCYLRSCVNPG